jgi:hypothetical protein
MLPNPQVPGDEGLCATLDAWAAISGRFGSAVTSRRLRPGTDEGALLDDR